MLNRFMLAVAPMILVASSAVASDDLLSRLAAEGLDDNQPVAAEVAEDTELGEADVAALLDEDGEASGEEAIAACFRRIGYGYGYRSYRHSYSSCYSSWCSPVCHTSYSYFPSTYCYRPVSYTYYTPCYTSYWGCW